MAVKAQIVREFAQKTHRRTSEVQLSGLVLLVSVLAPAVRGQTFTEFPIPTANSGATGIAAWPDGALWFTEYSGNKIGRITIASASSIPVLFPTMLATLGLGLAAAALWLIRRV